jgi:hypothetical protein
MKRIRQFPSLPIAPVASRNYARGVFTAKGDTHSDYHQWTPQKDSTYRQWYSNTYQGRDYRDYKRLDREEQHRYRESRHARHEHEEYEEHERDRDQNPR